MPPLYSKEQERWNSHTNSGAIFRKCWPIWNVPTVSVQRWNSARKKAKRTLFARSVIVDLNSILNCQEGGIRFFVDWKISDAWKRKSLDKKSRTWRLYEWRNNLLESISQKVFQTPLLFFILYAGTISGARKEKNPSLTLSRSIFPKAHSTADLISPKSKGFIAW